MCPENRATAAPASPSHDSLFRGLWRKPAVAMEAASDIVPAQGRACDSPVKCPLQPRYTSVTCQLRAVGRVWPKHYWAGNETTVAAATRAAHGRQATLGSSVLRAALAWGRENSSNSQHQQLKSRAVIRRCSAAWIALVPADRCFQQHGNCQRRHPHPQLGTATLANVRWAQRLGDSMGRC